MARKSEFSDNVDKNIGERINGQRIYNGWSRQQLAAKIGVTHQQLQKYEKGTNRLSPGRMILIARALDKPISWLVDDIISVETPLPTQHQRMCIEVSRNFLRIKNPIHQNMVNMLVRTLSEN